MTTHLSDKGQLQGDVKDDLGVIRCQFLGSVWGEEVTSQSSVIEQQRMSGTPAGQP